jgi:CysZ protein
LTPTYKGETTNLTQFIEPLLKEIIIAIDAYFKAHRFITKHKLWKWIIIPGLIYALLFVVSMYFFSKSATGVIEYITEASGLRNWVQQMRNSWLGFFFTLAGVIIWLILMAFYFSLFKYLWLILGSPIFAYLSEKTDAILNEREQPARSGQLLKDMWRGVRIALRNAGWQTVYTISILLLSLIPIVGWATPILALFVECYYYGFSMLDYNCERRKLSPAESIAFIGQHRGLAIGNGIVFYLMHALVVVGWVLAPAYAVVAATISMHQVRE